MLGSRLSLSKARSLVLQKAGSLEQEFARKSHELHLTYPKLEPGTSTHEPPNTPNAFGASRPSRVSLRCLGGRAEEGSCCDLGCPWKVGHRFIAAVATRFRDRQHTPAGVRKKRSGQGQMAAKCLQAAASDGFPHKVFQTACPDEPWPSRTMPCTCRGVSICLESKQRKPNIGKLRQHQSSVARKEPLETCGF